MEKEEKEKVKEKNKVKPKTEKIDNIEKTEKKKSVWSAQSLTILLLIALISIVLIIIQVPYTTTNVVKETVPVEKCENIEIPFSANFRTGFKYSDALSINSLEGVAIYKYSKLETYSFVNIRNTGDERGRYCLNIEAYYIEDFDEGKDALKSFNNIVDDSDLVEKLENAISTKYIVPVCTENQLMPVQTETISVWSKSILSDDAKEEYDLNKIYILFSVVAPTSKKCVSEEVEQDVEKETTAYCNAWKHLVGKC